MKKKNELLTDSKNQTKEKLKKFADPNNSGYKDLMKKIIVESMVKLLEKHCLIQTRKKDVEMVKGLLKTCEKEYADLLKKETEETYECILEVDETHFLENEW